MLFMYRTIQPNVCRLLIPSQLLFVSRQISSSFRSIVGKMDSGQDSISEESSPHGRVNIKSRTTNPGPSRVGINRRELSPESSSIGWSSKHGNFNKRRRRIDLRLEQRTEDFVSSQFVEKNMAAHVKRTKSGHSYSKPSTGANHVKPFDICLSHEKEENRDIVENPIEDSRQGVLQPGMVLLKHYISHNDQVEIVNTCRELGLGQGGFYRPGYKDGAKLRLQMMCLGLNWNPETRKYENHHPIDGSKPACIPHEFNQLVKTAIQDARALIEKDFNPSNLEDVLPAMSPDICIVNFYKTSGRLGLHQDRDESRESLDRGLPVVSFSVGDSAEFLYGDQRDVDKADKIVLESGDVLIFGGKSRHIFHGVTSIIPNSAPRALIEETRLRPGRLNLTFRRY